MKSSGYVLKERAYVGGASPPDSFEDESRFGTDGTHTAITWVKLPSGLWVRSFNGSSSIVNCGDVGVARAIGFWLKSDSTTESILEEVDDTGITIDAGSMVYGSWDNCFVDAVDTDTITAAWHLVFITSTTDVDVSALRLGLVNAAYLTAYMALLRLYIEAPSVEQIAAWHQATRHWFGV